MPTPSLRPTFTPSFEPTESPSPAGGLTTAGWCANDGSSNAPQRYEAIDGCVTSLASGTVTWLVNSVTSRMISKGLLDSNVHELCIIDHGADDYEWAVIHNGYIYPTCVQSGWPAKSTSTMVPNTDSGGTNPNKQANQLEAQFVFSRNNFMATDCPVVQSYCSTSNVNDWWLGELEQAIETQNTGKPSDVTASQWAALQITGDLEGNWKDNICMGDDSAVRYISDEGIVNTCTGYVLSTALDSNEVVRATSCAGYNAWECGFANYDYTTTSPAFPVNQFLAIAQALTETDYTYAQCSFNDRNYCASEEKEQRTQPRYTDTSNCVTDTSHPHYDASIGPVLTKIREKHPGTTYDLCYMEDAEGFLYYTIFVDGIGYPTCVQGPATAANCQTDKYYCVEEQRRNWPNAVANRLLSGLVFGTNTRKNHMHFQCPTLQSICQANGLSSFEELEFQPDESSGDFDNNLCIGEDGAVRVVTADGVQPTCIGYSWDTAGMGAGNEQDKLCPAERNFICGSLQLVSGEKTYGWFEAQKGLIQTALRQSNYRHPHCPYNECQEC